MTEEQKPARRGRPPSGKKRVTLLLSLGVIDHFKSTGPGWQARINSVLMSAAIKQIADRDNWRRK